MNIIINIFKFIVIKPRQITLTHHINWTHPYAAPSPTVPVIHVINALQKQF